MLQRAGVAVLFVPAIHEQVGVGLVGRILIAGVVQQVGSYYLIFTRLATTRRQVTPSFQWLKYFDFAHGWHPQQFGSKVFAVIEADVINMGVDPAGKRR
ncbi:hypothetical protein D3C75_716880 [compost metagenome]